MMAPIIIIKVSKVIWNYLRKMKYEFFSGPKPWNCDEDADDGDGDRKVPDTWEWQPYRKIFTISNIKATDDYGADNNNIDDKQA